MTTGRGQAFGLDLCVDFAAPGLPPPGPQASGRPLTITLAPRRDVLGGFSADSERLWTVRRADGRLAGRWEAHPRAGYLLAADGYGAFAVSADGTRVTCAPARGAAWRWQRYLVGQVLPFAAVVNGLEVFHASVVRLGEAAVAFVGPSRSGKSTVAAALLRRGAGFVADDVLTVDPGAGAPHEPLAALPGWGLTSVRHDVAALLPDLDRLGRAVGTDEDGTRRLVQVEQEALPLRAVYVLPTEPGAPGDRGAPLVEVLAPPDPRILLASSYNFVIRTPERLIRHLDACARMARTAAVARLRTHPGCDPDAVAAAVERHAATVA